MRVTILQDHLRNGGTERHSILMADALAARGMDATLLCFRPGGPLEGTLRKATLRTLQSFDSHLDWWAPGLLRRLRELQPDLILCMGRMANCHGARLLRGFSGTVKVGTLRTGKALPLAYRHYLRGCDHVIANSQASARRLQAELALPATKISVIANPLVFGTRPHPEKLAIETLRQSLGADETCTVLLNVGMFRPEKGQRELLESCAHLPPHLAWQLWLLGDGPELARCVHRAEQLGLGSRVRFLGWKADPRQYYEAANLAVHASRSESLSNFLIEAQAHGLPCIAYETTGNAECMIEGNTGRILPVGDRSAFAAAIETWAGEAPENRALRSLRARKYAAESFDSKVLLDRSVELFERLVKAR